MGLFGGASFSDLSPPIQQNLVQFAENVNRGTFRDRWELASANIDKSKSDPLIDDYGAPFIYSKFKGEGLWGFQKRTAGAHKELTGLSPDFLEEVMYVPRPGATVYTGKSEGIFSAVKGESLYPCYKINCEDGVIKTVGIWLANIGGKQGGLTIVPSARSPYKALFLGKAILRKDDSIFIEAVSLQHLAKLYPPPRSIRGIEVVNWKQVGELFKAKIWTQIEDDIQFIFTQIMGGTRHLKRKLRI